MKLEIRDLKKSFGDVWALKGISITFENGIYGILGPNGAGKSTLIHLITDTLRRESGEILLDGQEILPMGSKYRSLLGYMQQQQGYYEDFSAGAFLMYMAHIKGMDKKWAKERIGELLKVVNLEAHRTKKVGTFSGGMKQRLLLAQALLNDPKILILDEPTAGVDPQERIHIRNFVSEIAADRIVLLATHIVSDVEAVAKEIVLLKAGEIIEHGKPYELLDKMKNRVFEIPVSWDKLKEIQNKYTVSSIRHTADGLAVKVITDLQPQEESVCPAAANLEDVYLYHFNENEQYD